MIRKGTLPASACTGYITLVHKKGERADLANWRPITLLCADYKILAKVLALQLSGVIESVMHPDQMCGMYGCSAVMNLSLIWDTLAWAQQRMLPLALLSLDQEKAFEYVDLRHLYATLQHMDFGEVLSSFLHLLYVGVLSWVGINGHYSREVAQARGVRQGCRLSPLLYVIYLEHLLAGLRGETGFARLHIPRGTRRCERQSGGIC